MNANALAVSLERAAAPATYSLRIDVRTADSLKLRARLSRLKSTVEVEYGGQYREDPSYAVVWLTTTQTEEEVDAWLYAGKGIDYVGVFTRNTK